MGKKRLPLWARLTLGLLALLVLLAGGFVIWGSTPARPMPEVYERVPGLDEVSAGERWLTFVPDGDSPTVGLILYPAAAWTSAPTPRRRRRLPSRAISWR